MKLISAEYEGFLDNGGTAYRALIIASTTPESLTITGADVDGLQANDVLAVGSVLITPDKNYVAFADGVFTEKG